MEGKFKDVSLFNRVSICGGWNLVVVFWTCVVQPSVTEIELGTTGADEQ